MATITKRTNIVTGAPEWTVTREDGTESVTVARRHSDYYGRTAYYSRGNYWLTLADVSAFIEGD